MRQRPAVARSIAAAVIANLALFIAVVSLPAFRAAHHHWIFPVLAVLLAGQWASTFAFAPEALDREALRGSFTSLLVFLLVMGIARHATILACFDRCSLKLALAAAVAGAVFLGQASVRDRGFWSPVRAQVAAAGAWLWALYLVLRWLNLAPWIADLVFAVLALLCWLGRDRAVFLISALGIASAIAIRATANEYAIIGLATVWSVLLPLWAAPAIEERLGRRRAKSRPASRNEPALVIAVRSVITVAVLIGLARFVAGPISLVTDPSKRRAYLSSMAPPPLKTDPKTLSPLAARLRAHVVMLAATIGERGAYEKKGRERARDYVAKTLHEAGYEPKALPYESRWMPGVPDRSEFHNVEAVRLARSPERLPAWVVGAHYDSTPGTPGADDNASGTAVMLELARLLHEREPVREIRFVGFGTEEPPSFGTRNMGSWHYASALKDGGVKVHGAIVLEMLGYYNPRPGAQLYPPFLQLFYPDRGDFIGAVADVSSRPLLRSFGEAWAAASRFPMTASVLPGPFASLALSDQLNFWELGFPALMLSDTAFYRNANYHETSDKPDTLDYEKMAEVTKGLAEVISR